MTTLSDIEKLTKGYADARSRLGSSITDLEDQVRKLRQSRMIKLRRLIADVANGRGDLAATIDEARSLFKKPKSRIFHGVKVGLAKGKGAIKWDDADQVVKLIKRHLPDQAETLIKTTEKPVRGAIAQLSGADLKKIGVRVDETGDQVLIKPADSEIDKLVDALLADDPEIEEIAS